MAIIRQNPTCLKCGGIIYGRYKDESDLPLLQRIIGDTFIDWDWANHKCDEKLLQPNVISSVCDCEAHTFYEWEKDENKCSQCNKRIYKQTDL